MMTSLIDFLALALLAASVGFITGGLALGGLRFRRTTKPDRSDRSYRVLGSGLLVAAGEGNGSAWAVTSAAVLDGGRKIWYDSLEQICEAYRIPRSSVVEVEEEDETQIYNPRFEPSARQRCVSILDDLDETLMPALERSLTEVKLRSSIPPPTTRTSRV